MLQVRRTPLRREEFSHKVCGVLEPLAVLEATKESPD